MEKSKEIISLDASDIKNRIFTIRGKQVMLDSDLAEYFGTMTGNVNRAMKRNSKRFPESFCFQLTVDEISRCQIGISMQTSGVKGGKSYLPYVYTEQGIADFGRKDGVPYRDLAEGCGEEMFCRIRNERRRAVADEEAGGDKVVRMKNRVGVSRCLKCQNGILNND